MKAKLRDTEIYFDVDGPGLVPDGEIMRARPAAFLVHGGPGGDHSGFKPSMSPLAETMQVVYFDHRGQGRSARGDPARYVLDENVEDMEALRRHLGLDRIVSIGTSYGGMVAMAHASRYPDAVSRLVLIVTASHAGFNRRAREIVAERGTAAQQQMADRLWSGTLRTEDDLREYYAVMGPLYARRHDAAAAARGHRRTIHAPEPLNRAFAPGGVLQHYDLRPELPRITAPTLVIAGRHDWICPPEFSEEIHRLIPHSRLHVFEEASHSIRNDAPEALVRMITAFVAEDTPAGSGPHGVTEVDQSGSDRP